MTKYCVKADDVHYGIYYGINLSQCLEHFLKLDKLGVVKGIDLFHDNLLVVQKVEGSYCLQNKVETQDKVEVVSELEVLRNCLMWIN